MGTHEDADWTVTLRVSFPLPQGLSKCLGLQSSIIHKLAQQIERRKDPARMDENRGALNLIGQWQTRLQLQSRLEAVRYPA